MNDVIIGLQIVPQRGDMALMRAAWLEAEALGVDRLWTADHFHAQVLSSEAALEQSAYSTLGSDKSFEATTIEAAMAVTTTRPEIGCMVHAIGYRNPNLMADIARTIDHLSNGRYILGVGAGYMQADYDEYGFSFGTQRSRLMDLARDLPVIKARLAKLNPPPLRRMPLLVASMGDKIGLRIVAEHADLWNVYGTDEHIEHKIAVLNGHCREIGRNPAEIEINTFYIPAQLAKQDLDKYRRMGIRHFVSVAQGPDWDLGELRELLAWRDSLQR